MTAEERVQYNASFSAWYANRDQITLCLNQTGNLDEASNAAFDTGVELLQAWKSGPRFSVTLRSIPKVRCVQRLMQLTEFVREQIASFVPLPAPAPASPPRKVESSNHRPIDQSTHRPIGQSNNRKPEKSKSLANDNSSFPIPHSSSPLHIDQILYLLSPEVRQRAESLKAKLDDRDINSNEAKRLAIEGKSEKEIAPYAKAACDAQQFVTDTYALIDDELAMTYRRVSLDPTNAAYEKIAEPFGSIDRLLAALRPYYDKCNKDGRIDRQAKDKVVPDGHAQAAPDGSVAYSTIPVGSAAGQTTPTYDPAEYKRIWTYVNRKDVAHTQKRLAKMRTEIDTAIAAGMPNIETMETIYAHEAELVLADQQKKLNDQEPSLL